MNDHLTLTRPDDWHLHVRDGDPLHTVVPHTAAQFGRAIIMPNLRPPVTTAAQAVAYRGRIQAAVPAGVAFEPLMTLYLTDNLPPDEIVRAKAAGVVACKLYPAGATTNSDAGVTDIRKTYKTLEAMQREGLLLLVHGEVTSPDIDLFDREAVFIDQQLIPLRRDFPELKIVFEHITTREAAHYVRDADRFTGATLTAHHLLYNRNAIFIGGVRPHYYCLPVLKRETHRLALVEAATSGNPRFFLGTDSAPHPAHLKEHASGCAGCYTAHAAMELYAEAFDNAGALDKLEGFASFHGADFYGLPRNSDTITLRRESWTPPESYAFGEAALKPLRSGEALPWRLVLTGIDWSGPWFDGWRDDGARVAGAGGDLHAALNAQGPAPVRFVPQDALPTGAAYEGFIYSTGQCPTRENLHDFFNGLCWLRFPQTKRRLNQLQAQQIAADGVQPVRGPVRDALTVLDENGAFLQAPPPLWAALRERQWQTLFVDMRPLWAQARLTVFGHALLEKLVQPRKDLTAHVYLMQGATDVVALNDWSGLDCTWAHDLDAAHLARKPFTPLPVLGIPGWWPQNEDFSFYDDPLVFRPRRPI